MTAFRLSNIIVLIVVVVAAAIAATLLARTVRLAQNINDKAGNIANTGRGINIATDSVVQLTRTNKLAGSILNNVEPISPRLNVIIRNARSIDRTAEGILGNARSINGTARGILGEAREIGGSATSIGGSVGGIGQTAGQINQTARGIRGTASAILGTARLIDRDVRLINAFLDDTIRIASDIKNDTANILDQAVKAHDTAACIDRKLGGTASTDGDCQGRAATARERDDDREKRSERSESPEPSRAGNSYGLGLELPKLPPLPKTLDLQVPGGAGTLAPPKVEAPPPGLPVPTNPGGN